MCVCKHVIFLYSFSLLLHKWTTLQFHFPAWFFLYTEASQQSRTLTVSSHLVDCRDFIGSLYIVEDVLLLRHYSSDHLC